VSGERERERERERRGGWRESTAGFNLFLSFAVVKLDDFWILWIILRGL
jgi:hypothetical protein